jgi:hypothetical protein
MKTGLESLDTGAPEITYSGNQGPKSPQEDQQKMAEFQMAQLEEEYAKYVFEMEEQGLEPMSMQQFMEQAIAEARQDVKDGGMMRTAFRGGGMDMGNKSNQSQSANMGSGGGDGNTNRERGIINQFQGPRGTTASTIAPVDRSAIDQFSEYGRNVMNQNLDSLRPTVLEKAIDLYKNISPTGILINLLSNIKNKKISPSINDDDDDNVGDGDGQQIIFPNTMAQVTEPITTDIDLEDENKFELRPDDLVSRYSIPDQFRLADGGRASYAGGGITDLRQGYFLGNLVKKATRAVKKIAKSPLGKAALLYAGGTYLGGLKGLSGAKKNMGFLKSLKTPSNLRNLVNIRNLIPGFSKQSEADIIKEVVSGDAYKLLAKTDPEAASTFLSNALSGKSKTPGLGTFAAVIAPAIAGGLYTKKTEKNQPTLDEAMAQSSRGSSPFDQYNGVQGFREMINRGNLDRSMFPFLQPTSYAADGGRIGYDMGGIASLRSAALNEIYGINDDENEIKKLALGGSAGMPPVTMVSEGVDTGSFPDDESTGMAQATPTMPNQMPMRQPMMNPMMARMNPMMARGMMNPMMGRGMPMMGGRMMANEGGIMMASAPDPMDERNTMMENLAMEYYGRPLKLLNEQEIIEIEEMMDDMDPYGSKPMARPDRVMAQEGGMMDMGGMEKDYRNEGGFVPIGGQERADDVPARLSKNEFVFTADAVRNAGGGDIDKGAEIMENMMENLEAGGKVSKASQGLSGAREMFATQQRLGEVL